jgi:hypothetical protein
MSQVYQRRFRIEICTLLNGLDKARFAPLAQRLIEPDESHIAMVCDTRLEVLLQLTIGVHKSWVSG